MIWFALIIGLILLSGLSVTAAAPFEADAQVRALLGELPQTGGES